MNLKDKTHIFDMIQCEVCQKEASRRCGGCHRIYYCSRIHQKEDWVRHKHVCRAFKICENEDNSYFLVAAKTLNPGEIVLQESPLIWGPALTTIPVCLGCGKQIDENSRPCFKCGWPVCGELCEKSPGHLPECRYTSQKGDRVDIKKFGVQHPIYKCITILRCLYHKQFLPKTWKKLEKLKRCKIKGHQENEWTKMAEFIRRFFKLYSVFSIEEVLEVCGLVLTNSHNIPLTEPPSIAIYGTASSIEHNCSANCTVSYTDVGQITISAARRIEEGDHLTISYVNPLWGTTNRRYHLHEKRSVWCHCHRCEDPSEFGTNFSALRCQKPDCEGYLLPPNFTDMKKLPDWVCNSCSQAMSSYLVHDILERAEKDLSGLDKNSFEDCTSFLKTYGLYLHKNHFYGVGVKFLLCQRNVEELSDDELVLKLEFCQDLEDLVRRIAPAEKRFLGKVLWEKFLGLGEAGRRSEGENFNESKEILVEVVEMLKHEPGILEEGLICGKAVQKLEMIKEMTR